MLDRPVKVKTPMEWEYVEDALVATCSIDGNPCRAYMTVRSFGTEFPDCLKILAWAKTWLKENPTTCEGFTEAAYKELNGEDDTRMEVEVLWKTSSHGSIKSRIGRKTF